MKERHEEWWDQQPQTQMGDERDSEDEQKPSQHVPVVVLLHGTDKTMFDRLHGNPVIHFIHFGLHSLSIITRP